MPSESVSGRAGAVLAEMGKWNLAYFAASGLLVAAATTVLWLPAKFHALPYWVQLKGDLVNFLGFRESLSAIFVLSLVQVSLGPSRSFRWLNPVGGIVVVGMHLLGKSSALMTGIIVASALATAILKIIADRRYPTYAEK